MPKTKSKKKRQYTLELCASYLQNHACQDCSRLHLCRSFILGDACECRSQKSKGVRSCMQSHDVLLAHNHHVLTTVPGINPEEYEERESLVEAIRTYLQTHRNRWLIPLVCQYYNTVKGCTKEETCTMLHVCWGFMMGTCSADITSCNYKHTMTDERNIHILKTFGIVHRSDSLVQEELCSLYKQHHVKMKNIEEVEKVSPELFEQIERAKSQPYLCHENLVGNCSPKKCLDLHEKFNLPFSWQYRKRGASAGRHRSRSHWLFLTVQDSTMLEDKYCSVGVNTWELLFNTDEIKGVELTVWFETMAMTTGTELYDLRRLSTRSSAVLNHCCATKWMWYNTRSLWAIHTCSPSLEELEVLYLQDPESQHDCIINNRKCKVNFKMMKIIDEEKKCIVSTLLRRPCTVNIANQTSKPCQDGLTSHKETTKKKKKIRNKKITQKQKHPPLKCRQQTPDDGNSEADTVERTDLQVHSEDLTLNDFGVDEPDDSMENRVTTCSVSVGTEQKNILQCKSSKKILNTGKTVEVTSDTKPPELDRMARDENTMQADVQHKNISFHEVTWSDDFVKDTSLRAHSQAESSNDVELCSNLPDDDSSPEDVDSCTPQEIQSEASDASHVDFDYELPTDFNDICLDFLRDGCRYERYCEHYHSPKPYQWQYHSSLVNEWLSYDADTNDCIELSFTNVHTTCVVSDSSGVQGRVLFSDMVMLDSSNIACAVRRLSTPSYKQANRHCADDTYKPYLTVWVWYVREDEREWRPTSQQNFMKSDALEEKYLVDKSSSHTFSSAVGEVSVNFQDLQASVQRTGKIYSLCRRPKQKKTKRENEATLCMKYLVGSCSNTDTASCSHLHSKRTFLWRYKIEDEWTSFTYATNRLLEKKFCDVENGAQVEIVDKSLHSTVYFVHFSTMKIISQSDSNIVYETQRCSTESTSTTNPTHTNINNRNAAICTHNATDKSYRTQYVWYLSADKVVWKRLDHNQRNANTANLLDQFHLKMPTGEIMLRYDDEMLTFKLKDLTVCKEDGVTVKYHICRRPLYNKQMSARQSKSDAIKQELCIPFLSHQCIRPGASCPRHHYAGLYVWQFKNSNVWCNFDVESNREIELEYCNVECDHVVVSVILDQRLSQPSTYKLIFTKMTMQQANQPRLTYSVRRLSTPSSVDSPHKHHTLWQWYRQQWDGEWSPYDSRDNTAIEKLYCQNRMQVISVHGDVLNFTTMKLDCNRQMHNVCRLPHPDKAPKDELCADFLSSTCVFSSSATVPCQRKHHCLPYQWLYQNPSTHKWVAFDTETCKTIENAYGDVYSDTVNIKPCQATAVLPQPHIIHFSKQTLQCGVLTTSTSLRIKRISTPSSILLTASWGSCGGTSAVGSVSDGGRKHYSRWCWWWQADDGVLWGQYSDQLTSILEQAYISNPSSSTRLIHNGNTYTVDFATMIQTNVATARCRDIRRRPYRQLEINYPNTWVIGKTPDEVKKTSSWYKVSRDSAEFIKYNTTFHQATKKTIQTMYRIQNRVLWQEYCSKRDKMKRELGNDPLELTLYSAIRSDSHRDETCVEGYKLANRDDKDQDIGEGVYFYTNPSSLIPSGIAAFFGLSRCTRMMIAEVLVGDSTVGSQGIKQPPYQTLHYTDTLGVQQQEMMSKAYDSCVDSMRAPSKYAIFNHQQAYPAYIIEI